MKKGNTSSAVMAQRAPADVEADDAQKRRWRALDFFPTPPWGARAGAEIIQRFDPLALVVKESACGEGHMSEPLREYFPHTRASDINDYGKGFAVEDFLLSSDDVVCDWMVTNPPFGQAEEFVRHGLRVARSGVAVLCRLQFLECEERYELLYGGKHPLTLCAPFCERLPMQLGCWNPDLSSATAYAWFFFVKGVNPLPIEPIPPGTRDRLWKRDDVRRFCKPSPIPLFEISREQPSPASADREKGGAGVTPLAGAAAVSGDDA